MNPWYLAGSVLAVWAIVVFALGVRRERFPGPGLGERAVIGISILLTVAAIASAVLGAAAEEEEERGAEQAEPGRGE